jgi:hypothetical protein
VKFSESSLKINPLLKKKKKETWSRTAHRGRDTQTNPVKKAGYGPRSRGGFLLVPSPTHTRFQGKAAEGDSASPKAILVPCR